MLLATRCARVRFGRMILFTDHCGLGCNRPRRYPLPASRSLAHGERENARTLLAAVCEFRLDRLCLIVHIRL